ncbi:MAG: PAS domain S-box protein [Cyanobacteria bacterium J06638_28]
MLFADDASSDLGTSCCPPKRPEPLLQTLVQANQKLLAPLPLQTTVPEVLKLLGQSLAADQMDIYRHQHHPETGELRMMLGFRGPSDNTHSCQPTSSWQNLSYLTAGLQRWLKIFQARESIWGSIEALPVAEQTVLRQQQIHSFLFVPVFVKAQLWGFIRCVAGHKRPWAETEQAVVQVIADSLGSAIARPSQHEIPPVAKASAESQPTALTLQKKYDLLDSVINSANALIFVKDRAGKYLLVNQAMANAFNCEARELIGQDDRQLYPTAIAEEVQTRDRQFLKEKVPKTFEQRLPIGNEFRTFLTSKTPYYDADNNLMGLIGISRDVTEMQQMREERDRFFQLSNDMICTIGFDGFLKRINPAFTRLLGYSHDMLLAQPITDFIHPHDQEKSKKRFARAVAGESLITFTNRWRCHNGDYRWLSWSVIPYVDSQICYATARDITARQQAKVALQESERRFRDVTEAAGEYVWEVDIEGTYTFLTERVKDVKGRSAEFLLGRSLFSVMPSEDIAAVKHVLQEASANKKSFQLQHRDITSTGKIVWEEVSGLPIIDNGGEIVGFRGTGLSITEKKEADATLRLFKQAVESSSDAICITDADLEYVAHNAAFAKLFEVESAHELVAEFAGSGHGYADPQVAQIIDRTMRQRQPFAGEVMMRSYQGKNIPVLLRANVICDSVGNIVGAIRAYTDISDRKVAEAQLRSQEAFLRSIYDGTAHRIFVLNVLTDGTVVYSGHNRAAEEATGRSSDSVIGLTPTDLFGPEEGEAIQAMCETCIERKAALTQEEHLTLNGQQSWVLTTFSPLQDHAGNIHRIIGTSFDITPIKQAEAKLKEQARIADFRAGIDHLLTRGEALRSMLQGCCEVIVTFMEAAFARIWLLDESKQVLELQASAGLYTHIDGGHARIPIGQFKIGLIAIEKKAHLTNDILNDPRLGDRVWAEREGMVAFAGYPLIVDEQLLGVMALFARQTLSEDTFQALGMVADEIALGVRRKQAELQLQRSETCLRQQAEELQGTLRELQQAQMRLVQGEKMSSLGQLVAGVAHEINNPVNFIYGNLTHARGYTRDLLHLIELYQHHYPMPHDEIQIEAEDMDLAFVMEDLPKLLNSMKVGAERIQGIVSSLRNFSRMDEAEMKAVNLHDGLDSTLMILQNRTKANAEKAAIEIVRHFDDLPLVECYAGQLNQVFMNILSNAIDALEDIRTQKHPEKPQARIEITTALTAANQIRITLQDNGSGIPESIQARLFDPFFTTKPIGKGTGMGLSISYQIVTQKHGGTLDFTSEEGVGTAFTITLPLEQAWEFS